MGAMNCGKRLLGIIGKELLSGAGYFLAEPDFAILLGPRASLN